MQSQQSVVKVTREVESQALLTDVTQTDVLRQGLLVQQLPSKIYLLSHQTEKPRNSHQIPPERHVSLPIQQQAMLVWAGTSH